MSYLYRGVSEADDDTNGGELVPGGNTSEVSVRYGDGSRYGQVTYGESEINTARAHQIESGRYDGCFVSTTRSYSEAEKFATTGNLVDGYIYVIDESLFDEHGVVAIEFEDSEELHEQEVSIRASDNGVIPEAVIVDKIEVKCT